MNQERLTFIYKGKKFECPAQKLYDPPVNISGIYQVSNSCIPPS
jgi:hypothetical protein